VLLMRLRCYLPSTSAVVVIATAVGAAEVIIAVGLVGLVAGTIVISAVTIRRRRAAAGACHACSHLCRGAMVPLPERDTRRWPHRSLTSQGLPLVVISAPPDAAPAARQAERVRG
jgi:hypothetical protein